MENYNLYLSTVYDFAAQRSLIRSFFGLESNHISQVPYFMYEKHLLDNPQIKQQLRQIMQGKNRLSLMCAPTGSGKTHAIMEVAKELDDQSYVYVFTPFKKQSLQNKAKYDVDCLVGSDTLSTTKILKERIISVTYDKANALAQKLLEMFEAKAFDGKHITLVIDEAHMLTSCQFRRQGLSRLQELIHMIKTKTNGNILYMSATFENCYMIDVDEIFACSNGKKANFNHVAEYICKAGVDNKTFITHCTIKQLNEKKKVLLRINDKSLIHKIAKNLEKKGYRVGVLTSETKEDSPLFQNIIENATLLLDYDVILMTSIIDCAVTLDSMQDGTFPKNIVPMYFMDEKNSNLDDIIQFSNRIRWNISELVILVDKHQGEWDAPIIPLKDIARKKGASYIQLMENIKEVNKRLADMKRLEQVLEDKDYFERANHLGKLFQVLEDELCCDEFDAFNRVYKEYMRQFFYHDDVRRKKLKEIFGVKVNFNFIGEDEIKTPFVDDTKERFDKWLDDMENNIFVQASYLQNATSQMQDAVYDNRFNCFKEINQYLGLDETIQLVKGKETSELKKEIKKLELKDIQEVNKSQLSEIEEYLNTKNPRVLDRQTKRIMDGSYAPIFEEAHNMGIDMETIANLLGKYGPAKAKEWLKEERIIRCNERIKKKEIPLGRSQMQQYALYQFVEVRRNGKINITLDINALEDIAQYMQNSTHDKWDVDDILKFLKLMYGYYLKERDVVGKTKRKKKELVAIVVRELRGNHTPLK